MTDWRDIVPNTFAPTTLGSIHEGIDGSESPTARRPAKRDSYSVRSGWTSTNPYEGARGPDMPQSLLPSNRSSLFLGTDAEVMDDVSIAESAVPPPLRLGRKPTNTNRRSLPSLPPPLFHRPRSTPWEPPPSPTPAHKGFAPRTREHPDIEQADPPPHSRARETASPLRSRPRSFVASLTRLSLTPSDMQYPPALLRSTSPADYTKAQQMLGLRRQSAPPPVPPKTLARSFDTASTLPLTKLHAADALEPQNGRTAWLHALAAVLVVFNCWGMANAFGLFQYYFESRYLPTTTPSAIAWIGSTQLALVFGLGVPVGRLVDKGYFRLTFHLGSAVMVLGILCTAWCRQLWSLWLVQGLVTGAGMGMVFCSGIVALMTWFDEKKIGLAMGLGAAGSCVGGIVYVLLARHFLVANGFATTMRILGGFAAVTMVPPNLIFRMRGQKHRSSRLGRRGSRASTAPNLTLHTLRSSLSPAYLLAAAGMFFSFLGVYFGFVYMITFASTVLKLSHTASTNLLIYMLAANLPGRFLPALISDRCIGPLNTLIPSIFLSAAVLGLWIASGSHNRSALTVIALFYGFVSAGIQVLYAPAVYTFCLEAQPTTATSNPNNNDIPTSPTRQSATTNQLALDRMGLKAGGIFTCVGFACLVGTPIGGALISYRLERGMEQPFLGAQVFAMASLVLGGLLLLGSRVARVGWAAQRA
ncbi:hypothetical protein LTR08_007636 [Meristemomyces frigidus]|nr:hypothetical protein LTR08_007636 [Meristemomyces frigidus]